MNEDIHSDQLAYKNGKTTKQITKIFGIMCHQQDWTPQYDKTDR